MGSVGSGLVGSGSGVLGGVVGLVVGLALVPHVSNVAGVGIVNAVGDNLSAAIRKSNTVLARGSVVVTVLVGGKVGARVVVGNGILVVVHRGSIVGGLVVGSRVGGGLVGRGRMRVGSRLVGGRRGMVGSRLVGGSRGMVGSRLGVVGSGLGVIDRGRLVVGGGGVVGGGVNTMVDGSVDGDVGGGMVGGTVLLLVVGLVHLIRGGSRLAHNLGGIATMGLVDGGVDGGGIAVLDALVGELVGRGHGHKGEEGEESLERTVRFGNMRV